MDKNELNQRVIEFTEQIAKKEVYAEIWEEVECINKGINDGSIDTMWDIEETYPSTPDFSEWTKKQCKDFLIVELNYEVYQVATVDIVSLQNMVESNYITREIEQWWKVSDWLIDELEEMGEVAIKDFNIWGNTHSAYAMIENPVLKSIAKKIILQIEEKYK